MSRDAELIPFEAVYVKNNELSLIVKIEDTLVSLPKSQIKYDEDELEDLQQGNTLTVEIPEWLATDRKLI